MENRESKTRICNLFRYENSYESEFLFEKDVSEERSNPDFAKRSGSSWKARLCYIGLKEETHCKLKGVSLLTLEVIWSTKYADSLTEIVPSAFQIPEVTPMGLSLQFGHQRELSWRTLYVQGRLLCSLLLDVTPPDFY